MNVQRRIKMNRMLWLWWLGVISLGVLLWLATPCSADDPQGESSIVIYQVTYTDKNIQNLNDPPTTNKGILMVTRITRTNSSLPSTETVSTGNQSMEYLNPGRTQETQLQWDGRSWVSEVKFRPRPQPAAANPPAQYSAQNDNDSAAYDPPSRRSAARSATTAELREKMQEIMELLSVSDRALRQAEQQIAMAADSPEAIQDAEHSLAQARKAHQDVVTNMIQLKTSLGLLQTSEVNSSVAQIPPPDSSGTLGTSQAYDPNRPIVPPAVLNNNVAVNGAYGGYGWPGAGGWPYFGGNVSIQTQEPNPDFDVGPRVIVREQK